MKELYLVKQRMKQLMTDMDEVTRDREKAREEADMYREERDASRRERHEAIIHRDKILRECFEAKQRNETFKGDSKESETLRKQFDALSKELANALSEAEVSKKRRDWSFSERDKMVKVSQESMIHFIAFPRVQFIGHCKVYGAAALSIERNCSYRRQQL